MDITDTLRYANTGLLTCDCTGTPNVPRTQGINKERTKFYWF